MSVESTRRGLAKTVEAFIHEQHQTWTPSRPESWPSHPLWDRVRAIGSELWLDTGSLEEASDLWTTEFSALTTNNTLLNREVQTGTYDRTIVDAAAMLESFDLTDRELILEIAFILNALHGLKLVDTFDAHVSVEEHTDLSRDLDRAVDYARRYHALEPDRFIVKIPLTAAGILATRKVSSEDIPVNHTLGFSARQNYVVSRVGQPRFVNVFLGRLNSFVAQNNLGPGTHVGEKAVLASQRTVRRLRRSHDLPTRQIGASFREGPQIGDLTGLDVMTFPPSVAREFLELDLSPDTLKDQSETRYDPPLEKGIDEDTARLGTLWNVEDSLVRCVDDLLEENLDTMKAGELREFFQEHGCGDVLPSWTEEQIRRSAEEGKIPQLENWSDLLENQSVGLDSLMNLGGLNSFVADQKQMDRRVRSVLKKEGS